MMEGICCASSDLIVPMRKMIQDLLQKLNKNEFD